jgi:class 3 adenylate cyclase/DNA-binding NarL/FixJ family response regulator
MTQGGIRVVLADDNLIIREGVHSLLSRQGDIDVVGLASNFDELLEATERSNPQVVVTDIRMPPDFRTEGIDAAREIRKRHPGTGIVILSQYDDLEYVVSLLAEEAAGYGYLLKDRVVEGTQLIEAIKSAAVGAWALDSQVVDSIVSPFSAIQGVGEDDLELLRMVAEGRSPKAIAVSQGLEMTAVEKQIKEVFSRLEQYAEAKLALRHLKMIHGAAVVLKDHGESLTRSIPAEAVPDLPSDLRTREDRQLNVTVLMSDVRGFTTIAEHADLCVLARQLSDHRIAMSEAVDAVGGTVMQFVGDGTMAVFGAPIPLLQGADKALDASYSMHAAQLQLSRTWISKGLPPFSLGIGICTGEVVSALLGSRDRLEYTIVGDTVNLAQRLQQWAGPGETVLSQTTYYEINRKPRAEKFGPARVRGRENLVTAYRISASASSHLPEAIEEEA